MISPEVCQTEDKTKMEKNKTIKLDIRWSSARRAVAR